MLGHPGDFRLGFLISRIMGRIDRSLCDLDSYTFPHYSSLPALMGSFDFKHAKSDQRKMDS